MLLFALAPLARALDGPLTPDEAIKTFRLDSGLKIECVASEPMVVSPVAVAWDERGRMFVVEDRGYPTGPGKDKPPVGQVVMLESSRHDGHFDKRTVYADGLTFPNGVMPWKGGVFVTCAPYLYYFKDTKTNGVADVKKIIFKGFQDLSTTQLRVSHPILNVDNWIYLTSGLTSAKVSSPIYTNHPVVMCERTDFHFRPDTDEFEPTAGTAQFGQTFDSYGHKFICSNRNHNQAVMMQLYYLARNPDFAFADLVEDIPDHGAASRVFSISANITTFAGHAGYFTSACGINYYRGTALPDDYHDNSFTCEPAGNLVHRDVISPTNSTFVARRAADGVEFLASPDNWCRPVNLATGPDGALYVCDMYRKTIEHPDYLPEATRKITDFESGKDKGRIYRIAAADTTAVQSRPTRTSYLPLLGERAGVRAVVSYEALFKADLPHASIRKLCELLNSPDAWWRTTAQRLLLERQDRSAAPHLKSLLKSAKLPETRVLALNLMNTLGALNDREIELALNDVHPGVRENAIKVAEPRLAKSPDLTMHVADLAADPDARVRFQCALSLGELDSPSVVSALAKIAARDVADRWTRAAVLTSVNHRADQLLESLLKEHNKDSQGMSTMLVEICRILGTGASPEKLSIVLGEVAASTSDKDVPWQQAAITGLADGLRGRGLVSPGHSALTALMSGDSGGSNPARARIEDLLKRAAATARDNTQPLDRRLVAISLLGQADFSVSNPVLSSLIVPEQPAQVQVAAVRGLGQMTDAAAGIALVSKNRWAGYTPPVRDAVLACLMAQPALIRTLLTAVEKGDIPAWSVDTDRRKQLMRNKDEAISKRATALFKEMKGNDRMKVYEDYKSILALKPDPKNGHAVFTKTCTGCHVFGGEGNLVGPDLTGIRNQPKDVLLLHIIVPEYEIAPIYTCYNVETKDGRSLTGLLAAETPGSITLRQALAHEETVQRSNIASMTAGNLSLMPDELEKTMSKQDLADLLDFLKGN